MKIKKILAFLFLSLLVISCSSKEEKNKKPESLKKQDFFVETKKLSSFSGSYEIKKTWKIKPSQDIILSSKASGRVWNIQVKFWDNIYVWKNLIKLFDNVSNYWLNLEKTNLSLESSILNYEQNKIILDKQVSDFQIALSRQKKDHEILEKKLKQDIKLAKINLDNSLSWNNSWSWFISKAKLDYDNLLNSNQEKIKSFELSSRNNYLSLKNIFVDMIDFSDWLLWVTKLNKDRNNSFENYLWVKNSTFLKNTQNSLLDIIDFKKNKLDSINSQELDINKLEQFFEIWEIWYPKAISFFDDLEKVLDNSIENVYFSRTQIDSYKSTINTYQTQLQNNYNSFLSFKSSLREFLNTYKNNEQALKKTLELSADSSRVNYNKILLDSEKSLNNSLLSLKTSKLNLENAKKTREITLKQLKNSINVAKNSKSLAWKQYSKLFVSSPINGVVSDILVDEWQDVSIWTPLMKISSLWTNEIEIWLNFSEISLIQPWDEVRIDYLWKSLSWSINSISKIADENLNYKAKINIYSKVNISWNIVDVFIPISLDKKLLALSSLKIKKEKVWEINVLWAYSKSKSWEEVASLEKILVKIWDFYNDKVEIVWCVNLEEEICNDLEVITNDISRYDENKFNIKIRK